MTTTRTTCRYRLTTGLTMAIAATTLVAAGCADDDDEGASGELEEYCEASLAMELVPEPDIDVETASPEEISATVQAFVAEEVRPLVDAVEPLVPDEIRGPARELISSLTTIEETGDISVFDDPEFTRAAAQVHEFDLEHCGWGQTSLDAVDFAFDGSLPSAAGVTSFDLTNAGDEHHVAILGRKKDGIAGSAAEAFAGVESEEQFDEVFDFVTSVDLPPGRGDHAVVDLGPGDYVLFCPIPVGTIGDAEGGGPPHFTQGMVETFTVE